MVRAWKYFIYALLFILFYTDKQQSKCIKELTERVETLEQYRGQCYLDWELYNKSSNLDFSNYKSFYSEESEE